MLYAGAFQILGRGWPAKSFGGDNYLEQAGIGCQFAEGGGGEDVQRFCAQQSHPIFAKGFIAEPLIPLSRASSFGDSPALAVAEVAASANGALGYTYPQATV
jgi:hypothetical protein